MNDENAEKQSTGRYFAPALLTHHVPSERSLGKRARAQRMQEERRRQLESMMAQDALFDDVGGDPNALPDLGMDFGGGDDGLGDILDGFGDVLDLGDLDALAGSGSAREPAAPALAPGADAGFNELDALLMESEGKATHNARSQPHNPVPQHVAHHRGGGDAGVPQAYNYGGGGQGSDPVFDLMNITDSAGTGDVPVTQPSPTHRHGYGVIRSGTPWLIENDEVKKRGCLGTGGYGRSYRGTWRNLDVKVKEYETDPGPIYGIAMSHTVPDSKALKHCNLVRLLGACDRPIVTTVHEFVDGESLYHYIRNQDNPMDANFVVAVSKQIAVGLQALHTEGILHRGLHPKNILLVGEHLPRNRLNELLEHSRRLALAVGNLAGTHDEVPIAKAPHSREEALARLDFPSGFVKLCDWGMERLKDALAYGHAGNVAYDAPETLVDYSTYEGPDPRTAACDVYSFGVILWEMWNRCDPFEGDTPEHVRYSVRKLGRRPPIDPAIVPPIFAKLITTMWRTDPMARPKLSTVVKILSKPLHVLTDWGTH